jgi:hypothetical protein
MNISHVALAAVGAFVVYFVLGGSHLLSAHAQK